MRWGSSVDPRASRLRDSPGADIFKLSVLPSKVEGESSSPITRLGMGDLVRTLALPVVCGGFESSPSYELIFIKSRSILEHVIDRNSELVRDDGFGFSKSVPHLLPLVPPFQNW